MKQLMIVAGGMELELLGISKEHQSTRPSEEWMPPKLNKAALSIWERSVVVSEGEDLVPKAWDVAVKYFIHTCIRKSINPFARGDRTKNSSIEKYLLFIRKKIVKYIDQWGILGAYYIKREAPVLTIRRTALGFTLRSAIKVRNLDMVEIRKQLRERMFFRAGAPYHLGKANWIRKIPNYPILIGFSAASDFEGYLWYEIEVVGEPYFQLMGNEFLFKHEDHFKQFVRDTLWFPITRALKFWTLNRPMNLF